MPTINGIGTRFYGIKGPDSNGACTATMWFTFLYFPILPLYRCEFKRAITDPREFKYEMLRKDPLQLKEVLSTYLYGFVIGPLLWLWPIPFAIREVAEALGYANEDEPGTLYYLVIGFAILYIAVFAWKWKDWDDLRGLPEDYFERLTNE